MRPWLKVGINFITKLLKTKKGNDSILVMIDYGTKMIHLEPYTYKDMIVSNVAKLIRRNIIRLYRLLDEFTSDRGTNFVNKFMDRLIKMLKVT